MTSLPAGIARYAVLHRWSGEILEKAGDSDAAREYWTQLARVAAALETASERRGSGVVREFVVTNETVTVAVRVFDERVVIVESEEDALLGVVVAGLKNVCAQFG